MKVLSDTRLLHLTPISRFESFLISVGNLQWFKSYLDDKNDLMSQTKYNEVWGATRIASGASFIQLVRIPLGQIVA